MRIIQCGFEEIKHSSWFWAKIICWTIFVTLFGIIIIGAELLNIIDQSLLIVIGAITFNVAKYFSNRETIAKYLISIRYIAPIVSNKPKEKPLTTEQIKQAMQKQKTGNIKLS